MRFRKLRIAWSVGWGIVAVLLCVLWVRSYWRQDILTFGFNAKQAIRFDSTCGGFQFAYSDMHGTGFNGFKEGFGFLSIPHSLWGFFPISGRDDAYVGFLLQRLTDGFDAVLPDWFLLLVIWGCGIARWLPWRFSLRTLLIATTLVAVVLGLIAWLA
jgi:hypothetical protein